MLRILPSAALVAFSLVTAPVHADAPDKPRSRTVHFADLGLTTDAGVAAFDARIEHAVRGVCPSAVMVPAWREAHAKRCWETVRANAVPQRDAAIAAARSGQPVVATLAVR